MDKKQSADNSVNNKSVAESAASQKRNRKLKPRHSTMPPPVGNYQRNLDEWLENCLKDATAPQLSSSSEFLDYNASSFSGATRNNSANSLKKQSHEQQHHFMSNYPPYFQFEPKGFGMFLPNDPVDRIHLFSNKCKSMLYEHAKGDFTSLPPVINFDETDLKAVENKSYENFLEKSETLRRFSDPCLAPPPDDDVSEKISDKNPTDQDSGQLNNNTIFLRKLWEQISLLHETNMKICRNLHETKVEIEALKHAPLRHQRRDSLSGLSTHSQPLGFALGSASPVPTYHSGMYAPGIMTDVIREVKEAARVREEALLSRVNTLVEERSWSLNEGSMRMMRDVEEMKSQIQRLRIERKDVNKRITKLEAENRYMRSLLSTILSQRSSAELFHEPALNDRSTPDRIYHSEQSRLKRNSSNFSINYGTERQEDDPNTMILTEKSFKPAADNFKREQERSTTVSTILQTFNMTNGNSENGFGDDQNSGSSASFRNAKCDENLTTDSLELRRELQEALQSKKKAEARIIALENMVKNDEMKIKTSSNQNEEHRKVVQNNINSLYRTNHTTTTQADAISTTSDTMKTSQNNNFTDMSQSNQKSYNRYHHNQLKDSQQAKFSLTGPVTDL